MVRRAVRTARERGSSDPAAGAGSIEFVSGGRTVAVQVPAGLAGGAFRVAGRGRAVATGRAPAPGGTLRVELPASEWSPGSPELFVLELEPPPGAERDAALRRGIGFRTLGTTQDHILLNGAPLLVRGFIRGIKAHDHANLKGLPEREFHERQIRLAKDLGFNLARWHSTVPPEGWLEACDRLGLLNQIEFSPQYEWKDGVRTMRLDQRRIAEVIRATRHHPSVFAYCLGNEIHKSGGLAVVRRALALIRRESPGTLLLDSCGWGEFDRTGNDFISQHIAYFFPFGAHRDMFHTRDCFDVNGSVRGTPVAQETPPRAAGGALRVKRHLQPAKPVLAHEIIHYIGLHDVAGLKTKFDRHGVARPAWLAAVEELVRTKEMEAEYPALFRAAAHFRAACVKEALERLRMSPLLSGYQMLQLFDTDRYENPNGIVDCFDEPRDGLPEVVRAVNGDTALLADMPAKCFAEGDTVRVPLILSQFAPGRDFADLRVTVARAGSRARPLELRCADVHVARVGAYPIATLDIAPQPGDAPAEHTLAAELGGPRGRLAAANRWTFWTFPRATMDAADLWNAPGAVSRLDAAALRRLERGGTLLFLFDPAVPLAETGLPLVRDHFKPVIWDRGHQLGGIVRPHPVTDAFPHCGVIDFQFARLIEGGAKVNLDALPGVVPAIQGIDKLARDRMDVLKRNKPGLVPQYTFRRFGYLFEARVGRGRLLVCPFRLDAENLAHPEVAWFARRLLDHYLSPAFEPAVRLEPKAFRAWVESAPAQVDIEPVMSIFWQEDDQPVESVLWWEKVGINIHE